MGPISDMTTKDSGMNGNLNRTRAASLNAATMLITQVISLTLKFGVQTAFIHELSQNFLGLNGLFSNVISFLSFADLGIGTAITVALYRPIAEGDENKVTALVTFYRKAYNVIIVIVSLLGLLLSPFIHYFIKNSVFSSGELALWFLIYLASTIATYFSAHKRSFLMATQQGYLNTLNDFVFKTAQQLLQILIIVFLHSFVGYLVIQTTFAILSNFQLSRMVIKRYPLIFKSKDHLKDGLDKETLLYIKQNVIGAISSKIGGIVVFGTDNVLLSAFIGLVAVAKYSNYMLIIQSIGSLFSQVLASVVGSIGNLHATSSVEKQETVLYRLLYLNAVINLFVSTGLSFALNSFISIWAGNNYLLSTSITIGIVINYSINQSRYIVQNFISGMGLYWSLRWKSVIEALVNFALSVLFIVVFHLGILGVVLGTLGSNLIINLFWEPYIVFHDGFERKMESYLIKYFEYEIGTIVSIVFLVNFATKFNMKIVELILFTFVVELLVLIIFMLLTFRSKEFKYFARLAVTIMKKYV